MTRCSWLIWSERSGIWEVMAPGCPPGRVVDQDRLPTGSDTIRSVSIPVDLDKLRHETARYGETAYLLTTGDDGRPHGVAATVDWEGQRLVATAGNRTRRNATERPRVALLWPPSEPGGYTLIVDADAEVADRAGEPAVLLTPTRGVLHRPGPAAASRPGCTSDCVPVLEPEP